MKFNEGGVGSKGEQKITEVLHAANVDFEREKSFKDLKGGAYRFDFYLPGRNVIIEYDGEQHFKQVKKFHPNRADFTKQQGHDRQKNSYCLAHGIALYRIPYWAINDVNSINQLLSPQYLVKTRWHNDEIWRIYQCQQTL